MQNLALQAPANPKHGKVKLATTLAHAMLFQGCAGVGGV